ncbi:MAG TPA: YbjQ family protein [Terriglobales bacterium]|jgi:uncharacterized protein YbjQ (UPF0145 family)
MTSAANVDRRGACYSSGITSEDNPMSSNSVDPGARTSPAIPHPMVTTAFTLDGYAIARNLGLVRGIIVRSRSIVGTIGATLQTIVGGNITLLTNLCEQTREHAFELMLQHAADLGANAVIGMRYDATEIMQGVTEVLAYGTAVIVEKKN